MLEQRNIRKAKFVEMSGQVCQRCGYEGFLAALEFHHVNPEEKDRTPANLFTGGALPEETIYAELDKCVLLCANCHRAFEASEWTAEFVKRGEKLLGYTVKKEDLQN
jgi:hypothetical protein